MQDLASLTGEAVAMLRKGASSEAVVTRLVRAGIEVGQARAHVAHLVALKQQAERMPSQELRERGVGALVLGQPPAALVQQWIDQGVDRAVAEEQVAQLSAFAEAERVRPLRRLHEEVLAHAVRTKGLDEPAIRAKILASAAMRRFAALGDGNKARAQGAEMLKQGESPAEVERYFVELGADVPTAASEVKVLVGFVERERTSRPCGRCGRGTQPNEFYLDALGKSVCRACHAADSVAEAEMRATEPAAQLQRLAGKFTPNLGDFDDLAEGLAISAITAPLLGIVVTKRAPEDAGASRRIAAYCPRCKSHGLDGNYRCLNCFHQVT